MVLAAAEVEAEAGSLAQEEVAAAEVMPAGGDGRAGTRAWVGVRVEDSSNLPLERVAEEAVASVATGADVVRRWWEWWRRWPRWR